MGDFEGGFTGGVHPKPKTYIVQPAETIDRWRTHYGTPQWKIIEKMDKAQWMLPNKNPHTLALIFEKKAKCVKLSGEEETSDEEVSDLGSSDDVGADEDLAVDVQARRRWHGDIWRLLSQCR